MLKRVIDEKSDVPVMLAAATRRSTKIIFSTKVQMTPMVDTNEREDELLSNSEPIDRNASPPNPTVLLVDQEVNSAEEEVPFIAATSPTTGDGSDQNRETAPTTEVSPEASDPALESSYTNEPSSADPDSSRVVDQEEQTEYAKARPKRIIKAPDVYGRDTLYS